MDSILYKLNSRGKFQIWHIKFDDQENILIITHGQENGKMTIDNVKVNTNKSGRSLQQQADQMLFKRYNDKLNKGYSIDKIYKKPIGAMLAKEYDKVTIKKWPVAVQPKLDGVRCLVYEEKEEVVCKSRGSQIWNHLTHIIEDAAILLKYLPEDCFLDGELYIPGLIQSEISGIIRAIKNINPRLIEIKYYIFDIGGTDLSYQARERELKKAYKNLTKEYDNRAEGSDIVTPRYGNDSLRFVAYYSADNNDEVITIHSKYVKAGFEGSIIRDLGATYHNGTRHACLLKLKDVYEELATIIAIHDCTGRESGLAVFEVVNDEGVVYKSRPDVCFETRREYYTNGDSYVGKRVNSRFFQLSKNDVPLNAIVQLLSDRDFELV